MHDNNFKIRLRAMLYSSGVDKNSIDAATEVFFRRFKNSFGDFYEAVDDNGNYIERSGERYSPERYLTELRAGKIGTESERKFFTSQLANVAIRNAGGFGETELSDGDIDMNEKIRKLAGYE
jgi:hypothetical protein